MTVSDYLRGDRILLDLAATTRADAVAELAEVVSDADEITDFEEYLSDVWERERLTTTGIGHGIALPHARSDAVDKLFLALGRSQQGIDFGSIDGQSVQLVFLMGAPSASPAMYLRLVAQLSLVLRHASFRQELLNAAPAEDVRRLLAKPFV